MSEAHAIYKGARLDPIILVIDELKLVKAMSEIVRKAHRKKRVAFPFCYVVVGLSH